LLEQTGRDWPDYLMACVGGGSNAGGLGIDSGKTAATIALGQVGILHGAKSYVIQSPDGQIEEPYSISAGLDYPPTLLEP